MLKTKEEIEKLKRDWKSDPCWDLWDTEGFEEHEEELRAYQKQCEEEWEIERQKEETKIDQKAEELGVKGLYRLIKYHDTLIKRQERAIEALADSESHLAYRILRGYED